MNLHRVTSDKYEVVQPSALLEFIRGRTTNFLFKDEDYFTANLDNKCVRIGLVGGTCYDIPEGHAWFARVQEASSRVEIEDLHDELTSFYL